MSTCLPTIIQDFDGSQSEYTWIGVAYLLTQTACQPLYGRISDLTGRKVSRRQFDLSSWRPLILPSLCFSQASLYLPSVPYCVGLPECVISYDIALFEVIFSQDLKWLIAARALSGVGGGGIVSSVWVITSELVEVRNRAKWSQALSVTWSCSAIAGPLLGGVFSCKLSSPYSAQICPFLSSLSAQGSSSLSWRMACTLLYPFGPATYHV